MTFPKNAILAGQPVEILGPYIRVEDGKWHYSHTQVIARFEGVIFLADVDALEDVEISDEEKARIEAALDATFPDVVRLARAITGQG
ncbi:hypothetical protein [Sphingomonas corticis]|uniref:Uncharacterized protein n=1 Tax=Sphingomonas corticis TaxID=2722791 RepID=A0ABX1CUH2_9SPHN|nr:hypothetical protein [Sphingomonas corticis]NJR80283.1 hypothetical protein [Sphingomonas corticis]